MQECLWCSEGKVMKRRKGHAEASPAVDLVALAGVVERFACKTVAVLGDFVADAFQYGEITRVSREAPVLILRHRETHIVPGGGANAANNFAAMGARVIPITAVGDDDPGNRLVDSFREQLIDTSRIIRARNWTTPTKTRFLAGWAHTVGQQVLRVDYEPAQPLTKADRIKLRSALLSGISRADALAVSDYGFGVVNPSDLCTATSRLKKSIPVTLDSRYRLTAYKRVGISSATPNEAEIEAIHQTTIGSDFAELERCGTATLDEMKLRSLLVTRGKDGMALFQKGHPPIHIPIHGSNQAVDVTGAGDTVLAAHTLSLASGATPLEAAHIANIAGGLVVMKRGTSTVARAELLEAIHKAASETNL
jgi:D-glycero-beta-D-manno-heptose-7-phosphate kinase